GIASYATNTLANFSTAGFTNAPAGANNGAGGTNNLAAYVIGTSGSVEFYKPSGANGSVVCGRGGWTNSAGMATGMWFPLPLNSGFVVRSGVGVSIQIYAQ